MMATRANDKGWVWEVHNLRGDATNASVWQRRKLHISEVRSAYQTSPTVSSDTPESLVEGTIHLKNVGGLQVQESGTAHGSHYMMHKQITSVGLDLPWDTKTSGGSIHMYKKR